MSRLHGYSYAGCAFAMLVCFGFTGDFVPAALACGFAWAFDLERVEESE